MKRGMCLLLLAAMLLPCCAGFAAEGDPLLSVDDLLSLEDEYERFLTALGSLLIERDLLSADDYDRWMEVQRGDYLSNGGYGSILVSFYPGVLQYAEEDEQAARLSVELSEGILEVQTMRRYTPGETATGLMLMFAMSDAEGNPVEAHFTLKASNGLFYRWDALSGNYADAGSEVRVEGETIFWVCQEPAPDTENPRINIEVSGVEESDYLGQAVLDLQVDGASYLVDELR